MKNLESSIETLETLSFSEKMENAEPLWADLKPQFPLNLHSVPLWS